MAPSTHPRILQIISGMERLMRAFRMLRMSRTSPSRVKLIQGLMRQTFLVQAPWTRQAQITMEKIAAMRKATPKMKIPDSVSIQENSSCTNRSMNACDPAMKPMEANRRIMEETTPREPMTRVPVFREAHAQQLRSFGRATIFVKKYLL